VIINLARRAHDHNWELDPITRSLLDNRLLQTADAAVHLEAVSKN